VNRVSWGPTEFEIQAQISEYLKKARIFFWADKQRFGKPGRGTSHSSAKGVADLLGIYKGKPLAIEVKTKSGELSLVQFQWLTEFQRAGGIMLIATCVEDVQRGLADVK
jgi:hypothetical protein